MAVAGRRPAAVAVPFCWYAALGAAWGSFVATAVLLPPLLVWLATPAKRRCADAVLMRRSGRREACCVTPTRCLLA